MGNLVNFEAERLFNEAVEAGKQGDDTKSFAYYLKAAEMGHAKAQFNVSYSYYHGKGTDKDDRQCVLWLLKALEQEYPKAVHMYISFADQKTHSLYDVLMDIKKKEYADKTILPTAYYEAAKKYHYDFAAAAFEMAKKCASANGRILDREAYLNWLNRAVEKGNTNAKYVLAMHYYHGDVIQKEQEKAVQIFLELAEKGFDKPQCDLAYCYTCGIGIEESQEKAAYWYEKAAEKGNVMAQYNLGILYFSGSGVSVDREKAFFWFEKSAKAGYVLSQTKLALCYYHGYGCKKDEIQTLYWNAQAAEKGNAQAQSNLGYCYEIGIGGNKNLRLAKQWYEKAAAQGNETAKKHLERLQSMSL